MKYDWIDGYMLRKKGTTKNIQTDWNWIRYVIEDKMYAAVCLDDQNKPYYLTLKLRPEKGIELRKSYDDIIPGYYMNKKHWNSIKMEGNISNELLKEMLDEAYELVFSSFSKKKQLDILNK